MISNRRTIIEPDKLIFYLKIGIESITHTGHIKFIKK